MGEEGGGRREEGRRSMPVAVRIQPPEAAKTSDDVRSLTVAVLWGGRGGAHAPLSFEVQCFAILGCAAKARFRQVLPARAENIIQLPIPPMTSWLMGQRRRHHAKTRMGQYPYRSFLAQPRILALGAWPKPKRFQRPRVSVSSSSHRTKATG